MKEKIEFLKSIHYFRAFAIISIVIVHVWRIPEAYKEYNCAIYAFVNIAREVMFHNSTIYFIFISGFLFHHLSPNFEIKRYYKNKLLNVVLPYIFITILVLIVKNINLSNISSSFTIPFKTVAYTLIYGKAQIQFWYIPFIIIVFLFSPIILRIPEIFFRRILIFASIIPLLGTRTDTSISIFQYIYFFPIYLQGIYVSMNYSNFMMLVKSNKKILILASILSTIFLVILSNRFYYFGFININESLFYIQKISLSFLAIITFKSIENKDISLLNVLAKYSFAIYFTHLFIGNNLFNYYFFYFIPKSSFFMLIASIFFTVLVILTTLFITMGIKRLFGIRSRYLIGA